MHTVTATKADASPLPELTATQRHMQVVEGNDTGRAAPEPCCVHELFEAWVDRTPEAPALVFEDTELTYRELDGRANRLACRLRDLGVDPEVRVAICAGRGVEMIVGILGVLKAGGAYVPLDPAFPRQRLLSTLSDSAARVLLTQESLAGVFAESSLPRLFLDGVRPADSDERPSAGVTAGNLAYVIYTSGSTGRPKGVAIEHGQLFNYVRGVASRLEWAPGASFATVSTLAADLGNTAIYTALACGGTLHVISSERLADPEGMARYVESHALDGLKIVPSHLEVLLSGTRPGRERPGRERPGRERPGRVLPRKLVLGGEAFPLALLERLRKLDPECEIFNHYGPTEATVGVLTYRVGELPRSFSVSQSVTVPIGRPLPHVEAYLLDGDLRPIGQGTAGELGLEGRNLARGYLGQPSLTAERFVPGPYGGRPGSRLYRTGDRARAAEDGAIEFLGRTDHQVKIRGYRVEPEEVANVLRRRPGVREALVATTTVLGELDLVAYYVTGAVDAPTSDTLSSALAEYLPAHMVPRFFVELEALPLTLNGKVDRRRLPAPEKPAEQAPVSSPATELERALLKIWSDVLGLESVSLDGNFFELGGHSLKGISICSRIRDRFAVEVPLRQLFESPTVSGLAPVVEEAVSKSAAPGSEFQPQVIRPAARCPFRIEEPVFPLSLAQQRLWFIEQWQPGTPLYNTGRAIELEGALDVEILRRSLSALVERHESLRTTFRVHEGSPVQVIGMASPVDLPIVDLTGCLPAEREAASKEAFHRSFNLGKGPLLRALLLRLSEHRHVMVLTLHHIISDGWSMKVLLRELAVFYEALSRGEAPPLAELPFQYADFASWQRRVLRGEVLEPQLAYWRKQLADAPPLLELPTDRPRTPQRSFAGASESMALPRALSEALRVMCQRESTTLFIALLAAVATVLRAHTGQSDVVVGSPVASRNHSELEGLVGFFVNTLVLRSDLSGNPTFRELLRRLREVVLSAHAHQDVPFEKLVEELHPERELSHTPLIQAVFLVAEGEEEEDVELTGLRMRPAPLENELAKFDLVVWARDAEGELQLGFDYAPDLFEATTFRRMLSHLRGVLESVTADPGTRLDEVTELTAAQRHMQVVEWNEMARESRAPAPVHELFEAVAVRMPATVAVERAGRQLTFAELNRRANQLAHHLRRIGVGPDVSVGLGLERSVELVVGILGILKAGGAYVPLDTTQPRERLGFMLQDARTTVLVTREELLSKLPGELHPEPMRVLLDRDAEHISGESTANPASGVTVDHLAYVIYTSGSTGRPKGSQIPHRSIPGFLFDVDYLCFDERQTLLQYSSISWDALTLELWPALLTGARCVLVAERLLTAQELGRAIADHGVTTLWLTSSFFNAVMDSDPEALAPLTQLMIGGEAVSALHVRRARERLASVRLVNGYGPSECTVFCACHPVVRPLAESTEAIPVGRQVGDQRIYLLGAAGRPAPMGAPGELTIGGDSVARGYLRRPALTAERFRPDAVSGAFGERLYHTGDLLRWLPDARLDFLARIDQQVKVRGFRVELGEVEAVLASHPDVDAGAVLVREDSPGQRRLVAYPVPKKGRTVNAGQLRGFFKDRLPDYMVPAAFVILDALPLNQNRKVDRAALPVPEAGRPEAASGYVAPRGPVEEMLCEIFSEVLGVEEVGAEDSFFELGGHSLLAAQVMSRLAAAFPVPVPLRTLFEAPTPTGLAARIATLADRVAASRETGQKQAPLRRVSRRDGLPLSFPQQRLWFLHQLAPELSVYNVFRALRLSGPLHVAALERALHDVVARHEGLRTRFPTAGGGPVQRIEPRWRPALAVVDLGGLPPARRRAARQRWTDQEARRPYDLARGRLLRTVLLREDEREHVLLAGMHHIISDGWSMTVFLRELAALYGAFVSGGSLSLPELPIQYADYAVAQRQWLQGEALEEELSFWRQQLTDAPPFLNLPADRPRPVVQSFHGAHVSRILPEPLSAALRKRSRREGTTLFMTLLAAFQALLHRYTGQRRIPVGTPVANRDRLEVEGLIGLFINILVLPCDTAGDPAFRRFLGRARERALCAFEHQDLPFEKLVEELRPQRDLSYSPLFQVMFVLQNLAEETSSFPGLDLAPLSVDTVTAKFDLTLMVDARGDDLLALLEYNTDLFDATTVTRWQDHLENLLAAVVGDPAQRLSELEVLSPPERGQLLQQWNDTRVKAGELCVHQLLEKRCAATPAAPALVFEGRELSYGELNRRANQLAHCLRELGAVGETLVGVCLERSPELVVAFLAVLKAGGVYLPLDPSAPSDRLDYLLEDSQVPVLLTRTGRLDSRPGRRDFDPGAEHELLETYSAADPEPGPTPDNLAYTIYTSGSTGRPKGVLLTHRSLSNFVNGVTAAFGVDKPERALQFSALSFDASLFEMLVPLLAGGTLVLSRQESLLPGEDFVELLRRESISMFVMPPSVLAALPENAELPDLRTIIVAGEACSAELVERWAPGRRFFNAYGPTESTVCASVARCRVARSDTSGRSPSIGRPIGNIRVALLDRHLRPALIGVAGELHLGGLGLARGYLRRPRLSAERFIPDAFAVEPGGRLYKTGDLGRHRAGGQIEFLGRVDHQVKIRGFRLELGEVEAVLGEHPAVRDKVVVTREVRHGGKRLVAYVVAQPGEAQPGEAQSGVADADSLRAYLKKKLPDYAVPSAVILLEAMPLSPSGKVDRTALPEVSPRGGRSAADLVAPRTELEGSIAAVWREALGAEEVGIDENFFDLGGHSLLIAKVKDQLQSTLKRKVSILDLFQYPTIRFLAAYWSSEAEPPRTPRKAATQRAASAQRRRQLRRQRRPVVRR